MHRELRTAVVATATLHLTAQELWEMAWGPCGGEISIVSVEGGPDRIRVVITRTEKFEAEAGCDDGEL